jgi:alkylated DNA repair dioxygenase AlkB
VQGQGDLFASEPQVGAAAPPGFRYWTDVLSPEEERVLAAQLEALPFAPFDFHGYLANRRVVSFGFRYDYGRRGVEPAAPIPGFLQTLRRRVGELAGVAPDAFGHVLINEYRPGAGIGWHRDKPQFGLVVGVSLLSPCTLRLRRKAGSGWQRAAASLAPRSAYLLSGPARGEWEHSITPAEALRYSITFRTFVEPPPAP